MFNGTLKIRMFIDISWGYLKTRNCSSGLFNSVNLLIFKFRNSKFDLKYNCVNN